jgi:nucleoid-associated protein YgaU
MKAYRLLPALMLPMLMASCKSTKDTGYEDPYVSNFATDGGYNPYPGSGAASSGYETPAPAPATPSYEAPPAADDYAFDAPAKPAPSTASSSSSSAKPKPKTTTTASSTPKKKSTTTVKKSSSGRSHTVTKGDTLYGLARKYGTTVTKIKSANGMSGDMIRLGQKVKIP